MADGDHYAILDALLQRGVLLLGPDVPPRVFVSHGPPAFDCEQFAVYAGPIVVDRVATSDSPNAALMQNRVPVTFSIEATAVIVRCWPTALDDGTTPPGAVLSQYAEALSIDAWRLWNGYREALRGESPSILAGLPCRGVALGPATPTPPAGALAAWTITFRIESYGYDPLA